MNFERLLNKQKFDLYTFELVKKVKSVFTDSDRETIPVFILGTQRSGTTMLINSMRLSYHTQVFDESPENELFHDHRLKGIKTLKNTVHLSKARFVCLKPLADSHLIRQYLFEFPNGKFIWMYRNYKDVAYSATRKWKNADVAIRKVCRGQSGGGWFQEGVSPETLDTLKNIYNENLNTFELRCLVWWARNRLYFENELPSSQKVKLIKYEDIAGDPNRIFNFISISTGIIFKRRILKYIHSNSVGRKKYPKLNLNIQELCEKQLTTLNHINYNGLGNQKMADSL